jgi:YggT family protein
MNIGYLEGTLFPVIAWIIWTLFAAFAMLLLLRLIFNFSDPNPFGKIGRLGFRIRKLTEKWVYPAMRFLAMYRVNVKWAPLLTLLLAFLLTFFALQIIGNTCFIIDKFADGVVRQNPKLIVGIVLYALLSILILFIFVRVLSSWFVFTKNTFMGFVNRVTNPIMLPVQKLIPPVGPLDISAMIVLIVISLLQNFVLRAFVYAP